MLFKRDLCPSGIRSAPTGYFYEIRRSACAIARDTRRLLPTNDETKSTQSACSTACSHYKNANQDFTDLPECLSDEECGEGHICNSSNACEDDVECRVDADCGIDMICISNRCAQCRLNCECLNKGDLCMNGFCVASQ